MHAIITKYHGPANVKGSRVSATIQSDERTRITIPWDDAHGAPANHALALMILLRKLRAASTHSGPVYRSGNWAHAELGSCRGRVWVFVPGHLAAGDCDV